MITYTLEFPVFSVQVETFIGDKFNTADTEAGRIGIYQLIICIDFRNRFVERRAFRRPEFRCIYDEVLFKRLSVIDTAGIFFAGNHFSVWGKNFRLHADLCFFTGIVYPRLQAYGCKFFTDMRSRNLCSPYRHVDFISNNQVYIAVQARSRIPA